MAPEVQFIKALTFNQPVCPRADVAPWTCATWQLTVPSLGVQVYLGVRNPSIEHSAEVGQAPRRVDLITGAC